MTEPNNKFIEILPEDAFRIGLYLKSKIIVEPAFAVLVSEGAFRVAGPLDSNFHPGLKNNTTKFGRPKSDMNEDELNRIEAAANDFQSRINGVATDLSAPSMSWIDDLPEFRKLIRFKEEIPADSLSHENVDKLMHLLHHYVRGCIMGVEWDSLLSAQNLRANTNRGNEHYLTPYEWNFELSYDTFSANERYLTRFYWEMLRDLPWSLNRPSNMDYKNSHCIILTRLAREEISIDRGVEKVTMQDILLAQQKLGLAMISEIKKGNFYQKPLPLSCYRKPEDPKLVLDPFYWEVNPDLQSDMDDMSPGPFTPSRNESTSNTPGTALNNDPDLFDDMPEDIGILARYLRIPPERFTANYDELPFFSLRSFFANVDNYIAIVCRSMLEDQLLGVARLVDTLVCMSRDELKYLPLWAGGNEDGTGGVFEPAIPPAEYGVAPNGPGPAYHTGVSVFSQASSMVDVNEDDQMTEVGTVNTSIAVDNGLSSHVDRRAIMSDFGSIASFVHVGEDQGKEKGKGKEVARSESVIYPEEHESMEIESVNTMDFVSSDTGSTKFEEPDMEKDDDDDDFMMVSEDEGDNDAFTEI